MNGRRRFTKPIRKGFDPFVLQCISAVLRLDLKTRDARSLQKADGQASRLAGAMEQHMKKTVISTLVLAAMASPAFAHPGDHVFSMLGSLVHLLTEPDHLAMMAVAAVVGFFIYRRARRSA